MQYKILKKIMLLCIILCSIQTAVTQECASNNNAAVTSQVVNDLFFNNTNVNYFYEGTLTLNNATTINGRFSLNHYRENMLSVIHNDEDGVHRYISTDSIKSVILFRKEKNDIIDKTLFVKAKDDSKLYRMISNETDLVMLFDSATKPFSGLLIGDVFVKENDSTTNTYSFWSSGPKQDVINYINKRDNTKYRRRDFKTIDALVVQLND